MKPPSSSSAAGRLLAIPYPRHGRKNLDFFHPFLFKFRLTSPSMYAASWGSFFSQKQAAFRVLTHHQLPPIQQKHLMSSQTVLPLTFKECCSLMYFVAGFNFSWRPTPITRAFLCEPTQLGLVSSVLGTAAFLY